MAISGNKRIALNTGVLYIKLVLSIIIGLYTSRVVLLALGASDYGLYTVVGGIVSMMNFLGVTMMSVTYRYIVVEFGKGANGNPQKIFNTSLVIHLALVALLLIIGETFGIYYITHIANIAPDKVSDAVFVLHLSLIATSFAIVSVPFNGLIVAREKFVFTAVVEIGRTLLKLVMVIALAHYYGNRLRMFAIIMTIYNIILPICLYVYCLIKDREVIKWKFNKKASEYSGIIGYAFWIMIGAVASMGQNQGANIIINLFFNTAVNAAFGIGFQINNYVMMFVQSLNQAAVPQIMKSQSGNHSNRSLALIYGITKVAFFIMLLPTIPLIINMDFVLTIWLKNVPPYTDIFATLLLVGGLIRCLGAGFDSSIQTTGKIRPNQIVYSIAYLMVLPIAYTLYMLEFPAYSIIICTIAAAICVLVFQIIYLSKITEFSIEHYMKQTVARCLYATALISPLLLFKLVVDESLAWFMISCSVSLAWIILIIFTIGCTRAERDMIISGAYKILKCSKNGKSKN